MTVNFSLLQKLQEKFTQAQWQLVTAESCTGGGVAQACTDIPGSSSWFLGGVVAYDNRLKTSLLQVPLAQIDLHGAVSEPVVLAMAQGAQICLNADWAIATSGIAGPSGGSPEKPVGTVCFAWVYRDKLTRTATCYFSGDRTGIRAQSIDFALSQLLLFSDEIST